MKIFNKKIQLSKKAYIFIAILLSILTICFIYLKKNHYIFSKFSYTIDKDKQEVTITGYSNEKYLCEQKALVIPSEIRKLPVTSIGESAFESADITKLVLPNTVKTISDTSFRYCYFMTEIVGLDYVESIGNCAFMYCDDLEKCTLSVNSKATDELDNNEYPLDSFIIPESITFMDCHTFLGNAAFKHVTICCNLDILSGSSFSKCQYLETVNVVGTIEEFDITAFYENPCLTTVTISEGAKRINNIAFAYCPALQSVYLPASIEYIHPGAFYKHSDFLTIIAPSGSYAEQYAIDNDIIFIASDSVEIM